MEKIDQLSCRVTKVSTDLSEMHERMIKIGTALMKVEERMDTISVNDEKIAEAKKEIDGLLEKLADKQAELKENIADAPTAKKPRVGLSAPAASDGTVPSLVGPPPNLMDTGPAYDAALLWITGFGSQMTRTKLTAHFKDSILPRLSDDQKRSAKFNMIGEVAKAYSLNFDSADQVTNVMQSLRGADLKVYTAWWKEHTLKIRRDRSIESRLSSQLAGRMWEAMKAMLTNAKAYGDSSELKLAGQSMVLMTGDEGLDLMRIQVKTVGNRKWVYPSLNTDNLTLLGVDDDQMNTFREKMDETAKNL